MTTPAERLHDHERVWRPALRAASLVAELELDSDDVEPVVRGLGRLYDGAETARDRQYVLSKYPACTVAGLAGLGAIHYFQGTFWTAVWETAGIQGTQATQQAWGAAFLAALNRFDLPTFSELPLPFVGPIMMHAGVPTYSLQDLLNLLARRQQADSQLTGDAFVDWATEPGRKTRLHELDKPIQRFIEYGGEYARDFLERCLDLLDRLRELSPEFDGVRLPSRIIERARKLHADGALELRGRRRTGATRRADHPRLVLDVFGAGLQIQLPPVGDQPDGTAVWQLVVDGLPASVRSRSTWPGASETAPATTYPLDRPVRTVAVALAGRAELSYDVEVVDASDPLLVFTDDGRRVPATAPLPPEPVWVLHPDDKLDAEAALEITGDYECLQEAPAPYGWDGWVLRRLDLERAHGIQLEGGRTRPVRGATRPRLDLAEPVVGVRTLYGSPVYAEPPRVMLPPTPDAMTGWTVLVRRPDEPKAVSSLNVTTGQAAVLADPWEQASRPLVGPYEILVRGPLGRGLSRMIELVDGLRLSFDPPWREFAGDGLVQAEARAEAAAGVDLSRSVLDFGARDCQAQLTVAGGSCTEVLVVEPPHMSVQVLGSGATGRWSTAPLTLATEDFETAGTLLVTAPDAVRELRLKVVTSTGVPVQETDADRFSPGQPARVPLSRVADTVREQRVVDLDVEMVKRPIRIARVRPRRLASAADLDDGRLVLTDAPAITGLQAAIYQVHFPWRDPLVLEVDHGMTDPLPQDVLAAGALRILLRVDDPWLPSPLPAWPTGANVLTATTGEVDIPRSGPESGVARFLAGEDALECAAEALPLLYTVYEREADLCRCGVRTDLRRHVAEALSGGGSAAVLAVAQCTASAAAITGALVESGLAAAELSGPIALPEAMATWTRSALAGALLMTPAQATGATAEQLVEQAVATCGPVAKGLVIGDADPHGPVGAFGATERQLAARPPEVLDMVWRASRIAPAALLDQDSRVMAARELFDARTHPRLRSCVDRHQTVSQHLQALFERAGCVAATTAVAARSSDCREPWQAMPALSLAFAFASRLAARGDEMLALKMNDLRPRHVALARQAPQLAQIDLVLAELTLRGAHD
jgi:hypothetical protein